MKRLKQFSPWVLLLVALATALAAFLRYYRLVELPPGFTFDEAKHALDALDVLAGRFYLISPRHRQTPMGYNYLLAGAFVLYGPQILAQRLLTATLTILLIPFGFLAAWQTFKAELGRQRAQWLGAFTALLLASSPALLVNSRIGYEYELPAVTAMLGVFFFWRGYRPGASWLNTALASLFAASGFYLYEGSAPFMLVIPATLLTGWLLTKLLPTRLAPQYPPLRWRNLLMYSLVTGGLAAPLLLALTAGPHPDASRTAEKLILLQDNPLHALTGSLWSYAQPFLGLAGDERILSNLPGAPLFGPLPALLFWAGLGLCLWRIRRLPYLFLALYWVITLIAPVLTWEGGAAFYPRLLSNLPATYLILALGLTEAVFGLAGLLARHWPAPAAVGAALAPVVLVTAVWLPYQAYQDYFYRWANHYLVNVFFETGVFDLVKRMNQETGPHNAFALARYADPALNQPNPNLAFLYRGATPLLYLPANPNTLPQTLTDQLNGVQTVHLIVGLRGGNEAKFYNADPTGLIPALLRAYGREVNREKTPNYTIITYRLDAAATVFSAEALARQPLQPLDYPLGNGLAISGLRYGLHADHLAVDVTWSSETKALFDYTTFVQLLNSHGDRVTGVDALPERDFSTLQAGDSTTTHYEIPLSPEMAGQPHHLYIGVYLLHQGQIVNTQAVKLPQPLALP